MKYTNYILIIILSLICFYQCKRNTELKETLEATTKLVDIKTYNNISTSIELDKTRDSLYEIKADLINLKLSKDSNEKPRTVIKYRSSNKLKNEIATLSTKYDNEVNRAKALQQQKDNLVRVNTKMWEYCDSLSTNRPSFEDMLSASEIFPIEFYVEDNPWYSIAGKTYKDSTVLDVSFSEDFNIVQTTSKVRRKLWPLWPFKKKVKSVIVSSKNPYKVNQQAVMYDIR